MIAFALLPNAPIDSPAALRRALAEISTTHGERCEGHLDARLDLAIAWRVESFPSACPGRPWMPGPQALSHLVASGMPLVWKVEDMGQADLFLSLPGEIEPYAGAWARLELILLGAMTPQGRPQPRPARGL